MSVNYSGKDIVQLPFPKNVQQRPGMYIGPNNSSGMLVCLREILNNSVDEHLAGYCTVIEVYKISETAFAVKDNGRGIPFDTHRSGKNSLEVIFGELHAGRNFEEKSVYSTGINGVGGSCVNALSETFRVTSYRSKKDNATITFYKGVKEELTLGKGRASLNMDTYSLVEAFLSSDFFEEGSTLIEEDVVTLLRETAYLNSGLKILYTNTKGKQVEFLYKRGVLEFLKDRVPKPLTEIVHFKAETVNDVMVEIAFTYGDTYKDESIASFCNTINTSDGGTHVTGFKRALSAKLTSYIRDKNLSKEKIENEDVFVGLNAIVSVFVFNPKYTSQTKTKLANTEVNGNVYSYSNRMLTEWLLSNPTSIKAIVKKIELAAKARIAQKRALENVKKDSGNTFTSLSNISKFSDCEEQGENAELFLCEGESAGGTITVGRDKRYQAVFKLKGKILNTYGMDTTKIRSNKEVDDLISVLKCGIGKNFDINKLKFGKIIMACDSDPDGKHIELLGTTLFHEHFLPIIEAGKFYISISPLYKASITGKPPIYLNTALDLSKFINKQLGESYDIKNKKKVDASTKEKVIYVDTYLRYQKLLEEFSDKLVLSPNIVERVLVVNYIDTPEGGDIGNIDSLELKELSEQILFNGIYTDTEYSNEYFVNFCVSDLDEFLDTLKELKKLYDHISLYEFYDKRNGNIYHCSSKIETINELISKIKKNMRISRLKGLGEMNSDELWETTLNPEKRKLVRVKLTENSVEIIKAFMGNNPEERKSFLKEVFAEAIKDGEEV